MRLIAVVMLALLQAAALSCGSEPGPPRVRALPKPDGSPPLRGGGAARSPRNASYTIQATLDAARHQITATQTLHWTNTGANAVDVLPFHLYLNAFKNDRSLFMRSSRGEMRGDRATDTGWGWIQVESVQVGGVELVGKLRPVGLPDETVVELPLSEPIAAGAAVDVQFKFTAQLPEVFARTGYKGDFHLVGQWFPKIGVRVGPPDAERWECQPHHANSEFFADFGVYDVTLTVPNTYVVAATGVLTAATEAAGGTRTFKYLAQDVHDFVWMADPYMDVMSGQAKVEDGTVEVRVVHRPEQRAFAHRHLQAGIGAIEKFSAAYLPYPWPIMTIVDPPPNAGGAAGMEYPTLVTTAGDSVFAPPGVRLPEMVTIHEIGHNWFQGMLASNEVLEAWLDEGVNEWAEAKVMTELYGPRASGIDWLGWQAEYAALRRALARDPEGIPSAIATAAQAFVDNRSYGEQTYSSTMRALHTIEHTVGASRFAAAMKAYAREWAFKHPTGRDLFDALSKALEQDLAWFFEPVFHQVGGMRVAIHSAECRPKRPDRGVFGDGAKRKTVTERDAPETGTFVCEVIVSNTGAWHAPVEVELSFEDGSSKTVSKKVIWDDRGGTGKRWHAFEEESTSRLVEVRLDPNKKLALDSPMTHHYRLDGDGSASLRAGAWFGSMAQTLMQIVGP